MAAPDDRPTASPWRNPMFWLMVGLPAAAVVAGFVTLWLAAHGADQLVDPNLRRENLTWKSEPAPPAAPASTAAATAPAPATDATP